MFIAAVVMCSHIMGNCVTIGHDSPVATLKECEQVILDRVLPRTERYVRLGTFPPDTYMKDKICEPYTPKPEGRPV
jgi:hypothetical protein